jgi:hypothetical protein
MDARTIQHLGGNGIVRNLCYSKKVAGTMARWFVITRKDCSFFSLSRSQLPVVIPSISTGWHWLWVSYFLDKQWSSPNRQSMDTTRKMSALLGGGVVPCTSTIRMADGLARSLCGGKKRVSWHRDTRRGG